MNINNCIICETTDDLNTSMKIKLDDDTIVEVPVCDEHAEDITPKKAKELYLQRKSKMDELIEQAKSMGLVISEPGKAGLITASVLPVEPAPEKPQMRQQEIKPKTVTEEAEVDPLFMDARTVEAKMGTPRSVGGSVGGIGHLEAHQAANPSMLSEKIDVSNKKIRVKTVQGRGDMPIPIPQVIKDSSGTTVINVSKRMDDRQLQENFKASAGTRENNYDDAYSYRSDGYQANQRECSICSGCGTVRDQGNYIDCPKCNGTGMMVV